MLMSKKVRSGQAMPIKIKTFASREQQITVRIKPASWQVYIEY